MAKTSSEQRLRNANLSLSDENFGPNMGKLNREKDTKANLAKAKAAEASNRNRSRYVTEGKNINNTRVADVAPKKKAKAKAKAEYKMPKSTTPDMDTSGGNIGSRNSFDAGEVSPFAPRAAAEKLIDYPSRTADAPTPAEVAASSTSDRSTWEDPMDQARRSMGMKKGGKVKCMSSGGSSKASSRGDGCAQRGKTRGRMI
jgi:hypothetical protein